MVTLKINVCKYEELRSAPRAHGKVWMRQHVSATLALDEERRGLPKALGEVVQHSSRTDD